MSSETITFVSVGFESEIDLLRLQARSMERHLPPAQVAAILVIDNTAHGMSAQVRRTLIHEYGDLAATVQVLRPSDIAAVPPTLGWRSQQVLKLCVAALVPSSRYVVLDAKNHFVRALESDYFIAADNRMRTSFYSYDGHPLEPDLRRVLRYRGLRAGDHLDHFPATITPFVLDRQLAREMVQDIEQSSARPFPQEFVQHELTEFFLYSAWLLGREQPLDSLYAPYPASCPVVWPRRADAPSVEAAIVSARERATPIFTVHRRAFPLLDEQACLLLASFWVESSLFDDTSSALAYIRDHQRAAVGNDRRQQLRDLPHRVASLLRRRTRSRA